MPETPEVPVDVLPPVPQDAHGPGVPAKAPFSSLHTFYHPASGVVILMVDILAFGPEALTDFLATPLMCFLSFMITLPLVFLIQTRWRGDSGKVASGKAFLGAFLAGLPFSIAGTLFGAAVLTLSGLPRHPFEAVKQLVLHSRPLKD
jgi:hypothetical protein